MPCYYDCPGETHQAEIEKRSKTMMYFDIQSYMTPEQQAIAKDKNIKAFPGYAESEINERLCLICSIMDPEQLDKVSARYSFIEWKHETLLDWYVQHIRDDKEHGGLEIDEGKYNSIVDERNRLKEIRRESLAKIARELELELEKKIEDSLKENLRLYNEAQQNIPHTEK